MKKPVKLLLLVTAVALALVAGAGMLLAPIEVEVEALAPAPIVERFGEVGRLAPATDRLLRAPSAGEVAEVAVRPGQRVVAGELLIRFDAAPLRAQIEHELARISQRKAGLTAQSSLGQNQTALAAEQLRAQLRAAQREYDYLFNDTNGTGEYSKVIAAETMNQAQSLYRESRDAYDSGSLSGDAYDAAYSRYQAARNSFYIAGAQYSKQARDYYSSVIGSYEAQLALLEGEAGAAQSLAASLAELELTAKQLRDQLTIAPVTAPFAGVVQEVSVREGSFVDAQSPVLLLSSQEGLALEVHLLSSDAMRLTLGQAADCAMDNGAAFSGRVDFIAAAAEERVSTVGMVENRCLVRIEPESLPQNAGPGFGAEATFSITHAQAALSAPASALIPHEGASAVYLLREGHAVLTPVTTGRRAGGRVELTAGVAEGDALILDPTGLGLSDGARVVAVDS